MAKVIINNVECEANTGESLLAVARRNAAHIGYLFDSSAVRVLRGTESLSAPNAVETSWLQPGWVEAGHRLATEATITGGGPIEVLTRAEELRRQTMAIFSPPEGTSAGENAGHLLNHLARIAMNQVACFPTNMVNGISSTLKARPEPPTIQGFFGEVQRVVNDGSRVMQVMLGSRTNGKQ